MDPRRGLNVLMNYLIFGGTTPSFGESMYNAPSMGKRPKAYIMYKRSLWLRIHSFGCTHLSWMSQLQCALCIQNVYEYMYIHT